MAPYIIIFIIGITGSALFFPNCEASIVALSSIGVIPSFIVFGYTINLSNYTVQFPWLLAFCCAIGSTIGSSAFYFVGKGARQVSPKLQAQLEKFNFEKFEKSGVAVTLSSATFSLPPVTILSIAAGMTKFPLRSYISTCLLGKTFRFLIFAYMSGGIIGFFQNLIEYFSLLSFLFDLTH